MFTIKNTGAKVVSVTNRAEKHGKELVPAQTVKLQFLTQGIHLDELDKSGNLRKALFKKPSHKKAQEGQSELPMENNGELTEIKLKNVPSLPFKDVLPGYTLIMGSGLTATQQVEQGACKLADFTITPKENGMVQIEVNCNFPVDEEHAGYFACQVQRLMSITLLPPEYDGAESSEEGEEEQEEAEA